MKMFKLCRLCFFDDLAFYSIAMTLKNWPRLWLTARHRVQIGMSQSISHRNMILNSSNRLLDIIGGTKGSHQLPNIGPNMESCDCHKECLQLSSGSFASLHLICLIVSKQVCYRQVLNVTSFLSEHPGGELAILTFAGYWPATTMGLSFLNCIVEVLRLSTYS